MGQNPASTGKSSVTRLLLVGEDQQLATTLQKNGFEVTQAKDAKQATEMAGQGKYDALVHDGIDQYEDGAKLNHTIRANNSQAAIVSISNQPEIEAGAVDLMLKTDTVFAKPYTPEVVITTLKNRLSDTKAKPTVGEPLAAMLEQHYQPIQADWVTRVNVSPIITVKLEHKDLTHPMSQIFRDLGNRVRYPHPAGTNALMCPAASAYGILRKNQGYDPAMIAEEYRLLQVAILTHFRNSSLTLKTDQQLEAFYGVADELQLQLTQALTSFVSNQISVRPSFATKAAQQHSAS